MIFVTVGTQAPFDRLIKIIDDWAKDSEYECFAQIGETNYSPSNISFKKFLSEQEFNHVFNNASIIISHAGMGTIISSLQNNKVLLTFPRLTSFKEHRNDHQLATTKAFSEKGYIYPIFTKDNLIYHLNNLKDLSCLKSIDDKANGTLLEFIKNI